MRLKYICTIILCICFTTIQNSYAANQQSTQKTHTVNRGETLFSIASTYNVSTDRLYELNPEAKNGIRINQTLRIPLADTANSYTLHSIQKKETLYSVSTKYNIPIADILAANPGLNTDNFKIGYAIRIPKYASSENNQEAAQPQRPANSRTHKVVSKETLYSISKEYGVSMTEIADLNPEISESGLKKDMTLIIPERKQSTSSIPQTTNAYLNKSKVMKIGLLLPFVNKQDSQQARFLEFYEGFLLAVQDIKAMGYSSEIYAFDIRKGKGTLKLESLLETNEIKSLNLIIGGVTDDEISVLSKFAQKNDISYVIPFPIKNDKGIVERSDKTYQANATQSELYSKIAEKFYLQFKDYNIIIADGSADNDKMEFISSLKQVLGKNNASVKTIQISDEELKNALLFGKKNIIVPTSSSATALGRIMQALKTVKNESPTIEVNLFGYPDWQTYQAQFSQDFFKHGTYIYSTFYANNKDTNTKMFYERFGKWYGKTLMNTYPKYGLLGYDIGLYFMTATAKNINSLEKNSSLMEVPTLQSKFYFEKMNNKNGYVNTGLFFVHYKTDMTIEKIDYSK